MRTPLNFFIALIYILPFLLIEDDVDLVLAPVAAQPFQFDTTVLTGTAIVQEQDQWLRWHSDPGAECVTRCASAAKTYG